MCPIEDAGLFATGGCLANAGSDAAGRFAILLFALLAASDASIAASNAANDEPVAARSGMGNGVVISGTSVGVVGGNEDASSLSFRSGDGLGMRMCNVSVWCCGDDSGPAVVGRRTTGRGDIVGWSTAASFSKSISCDPKLCNDPVLSIVGLRANNSGGGAFF